MAADGYIKAAHSQLTSAVTQLQSEISQLQGQLGQQKQNLESDIGRLQTERTVSMAEAHNPSLDDSKQHFFLNRLRTVSGKADEKKSEISRLESDISSQIQSKQQALGSIQGAANQVNGLLSQPGIK